MYTYEEYCWNNLLYLWDNSSADAGIAPKNKIVVYANIYELLVYFSFLFYFKSPSFFALPAFKTACLEYIPSLMMVKKRRKEKPRFYSECFESPDLFLSEYLPCMIYVHLFKKMETPQS